MKIKCIKNTYTKGWINKTEVRMSLTIGKEYFCQAVPIFSNMTHYADIDKNDIKFLVYNDSGEWEVYNKSFFAPA